MQPVLKRKTPKSCPVPNSAQPSHSGHGTASASGPITAGQLTGPHILNLQCGEGGEWEPVFIHSSIQLCLAVPNGTSDLWLFK